MKASKLSLTVLLISIFFSCKEDDAPVNDPPQPTLMELREASTAVFTSAGDAKTWRIDKATLTNGSAKIDISQNFNVSDDEFIFAGTTENGTLEWRKGYAIKTQASSSGETLWDKYVSSVSGSFRYEEDSSTLVKADFGSTNSSSISATHTDKVSFSYPEENSTLNNANTASSVFQLNEDNSISATITNADNSVLDFTLVEKTQTDYATASASDLNFTTAFTFESNSIACCAPGMIGSYADNSFFVVTRESDLNNGNGAPERVLKFDVANNTVTEKLFFQFDFVSKQLHIIDTQLIVIGGQFVNTYDLNLSADPSTTNHGKSLSRFGISVLDNDAYIIGGDLNNEESDKVFKWNMDTKTLSEFATMPEPRSGARGTIVNDNLYVFGGSPEFFGDAAANTIYKINTKNPSEIESFQMNRPIHFTFVQKHQNLIYVAGRIEVIDSEGTVIGREHSIGVFNTLDNSYQELTSNLTKTGDYDTIHQMCVFNGKMYVIYGGEGTDNGGQFNQWEVLVSDLD
ncbi:MAG: hypothetical protein OIF50_10790 [Flavobacteriaceae bacterium]|nr:hypothetical protein [Flavobacteriaceae bacterium]